jgi:branched-chain amino acid transport system ATP-binding protein
MSTAAVPVLEARTLVKRFGGFVATDNVDLQIRAGETHAVIGPNGAGKTTLIKQLSGELPPDNGAILLEGAEITAKPMWCRALAGIGRSFQITAVFSEFAVVENVMLALQAHRGHSFHFWRRVANDRSLREAACEALDRVGLAGKADRATKELGYGELRQLELAMVICARPKVLLLDEPLAGMGASESRNVVKLIESFHGRFSILLVEHDMNAVFALADRITVLVYGRVLTCGSPGDVRVDPNVRASYLGQSG